MQYFLGSYLVSIIGVITAYLWAEHINTGSGLTAIFVVFILAILEISLSFDNAVVNAMKLEKMSQVWRHRFLTWGIAIAVFGMRFLFPILVVSIFAKLSMLEVTQIALKESDKYAHYLHLTHAPIVSFGGIFLLMLFLHYFFDEGKETHWIEPIEKSLCKLDTFRGIEIIIASVAILLTQNFMPTVEEKLSVVISGIFGIITYLGIDGISHYLERAEQKKISNCAGNVACGGFVAFMYLELIDASFSLDGVLGAFALSRDIVIITIGLAIGAMFVRSLTIMLVEKKTLAQFLYLEHGAHWAIGALAVIMLISTRVDVPEIITGLIGLVFIVCALVSSIIHNKKIENYNYKK